MCLVPEQLRVWLVHDWLTGFRGGEKVLLELVRMFPRARIATLLHVPGASHPEIDARVCRTSFLQRIPGMRRGYRNFLPLFPAAVRSLKLDGDCDLVLSVSHAVAKGVTPPAGVPHVCYCNTPMRYIWGLENQYGRKVSLGRMGLAAVKSRLQRFDCRTENVTAFVANSHNVAGRIDRIYGREARVVYAGIDHGLFTPGKGRRGDFYLCAGALVPYKRIDIAVRAFRRMNRKLIVIGNGPEEKRLRRMAQGCGNIEFLGHVSDEVLRDHYRGCRGFIFPGLEDFGFTPAEAQACGAPVIAYRAGGVLETVSDSPVGRTGVFYEDQEEGLADAIERFENMTFDEEMLRQNAQRFTWDFFSEGILEAITDVMGIGAARSDAAALVGSGRFLCE